MHSYYGELVGITDHNGRDPIFHDIYAEHKHLNIKTLEHVASLNPLPLEIIHFFCEYKSLLYKKPGLY
jgi:hypothetical protein